MFCFVGGIVITIDSFFSKAKRMAASSKTKSLIDGLRRIAKKSASGSNDEKALAEMRQLLFKHGFSPGDVDMAFMQAQQNGMLDLPSIEPEKGFDVQEMLFSDKSPKKDSGANPFDFKEPLLPVLPAPKRGKKKFAFPMGKMPPALGKLPPMDFNMGFPKDMVMPKLLAPNFKAFGFSEQKSNKGVKGLDFLQLDKNHFSFVPKKTKKEKKVSKLFKKILLG